MVQGTKFFECALRLAVVHGTKVRRRGARVRQGDVQDAGGELLINLLKNSPLSFSNCALLLAGGEGGLATRLALQFFLV
jgi:hypothetical protein